MVATGELIYPDTTQSAAAVGPYWAVRESLYVVDGVLLYQDHVVVHFPFAHKYCKDYMRPTKEYLLWNVGHAQSLFGQE